MSNLKLGVEVLGAADLAPKDSDGTSSPYVELTFNGQRVHTSTKEKDLNPLWNERFFFNIADPAELHVLSLEVCVYSHSRTAKTRSFLGKVEISGTVFVDRLEAAVVRYPLQKRGIFSKVKGDIGLHVYLTDDPAVRLSNPLPAIDSFIARSASVDPPPATANHAKTPQPAVAAAAAAAKEKSQYVFHSIPQVMPPQPPPPHMMPQAMPYHPLEYAVKETQPAAHVVGQPLRTSSHDLVERMLYLYVRVVKARDLPNMDITGGLDPYVEVIVGNSRGRTKIFEKNKNPEWNEVFAFSRQTLQSHILEVRVKDKDLVKDDFVGAVRFELADVPTRVPPDSPLAAEWYRLEGDKGEKVKGELMLAVWMGTQADEAFASAWHADAAESSVASDVNQHVRSKVYHAPRLWYVRVNVIEAQDIAAGNRTRFADLFVKMRLGGQVLRTKSAALHTGNPRWNEDIVLVAAEPFDENLVVSVEDRVGESKEETIGSVVIPLSTVMRRVDDSPVVPRWYALLDKEKSGDLGERESKERRFASRIHLRVCLDGGYHVLDESTHHSSDLRPSARQLWRPAIGLLELGIIGAEGFHPQKTRDGRGVADTYCVAKYGQKWIRTRTIVDSLTPKYNEQYTWEVFDISTVITVAVFDNCQIGGKGAGDDKSRDLYIGKVRIRLSTLHTGRAYDNSYPLISLHHSGVKKMGELRLAVRFSATTSYLDLLRGYSRPLLPWMHYVMPFPSVQQEYLRKQAVGLVAERLRRTEPPLRREVVEYMCDTASYMWSIRKSKANFFRLTSVFSGVISAARWFGSVCAWESPLRSILAHIVFLFAVSLPEFILPTLSSYVFFLAARKYWYRPRHPPHMDIRVSCAENVHPEELDEEFDTFPSSRSPELVSIRYDRLRGLAGRIQTLLGDVVAQGERFEALVSWRDPRATFMFMLFSLLVTLVLIFVPLQVLAGITGVYVMRHPRFRGRTPSSLTNFFRRLPARTDSML